MDRGLAGRDLVEFGSLGSRQVTANDVRIHERLEGSRGLRIVGVEIGVERGLDVQGPLHFGEDRLRVDDHQPVRRKDLRNGEA